MSRDGLGRDFRWFWTARLVAVVGSALTAVALPVVVYDLTRSASLTSMVTALQVAPYLLFGLLAGAMGDRLPRRRVMLAAQFASAAALLSIPVADHLDELHVGHVLAVAALVASAFVWFDAAAFGALPAIVGRDAIVAANSALWTASTLLGIGGPALGGLLVALFGAQEVLAVDAACYLLASGCLVVIVRPMGPDKAAVPGRKSTITADIREGVRFIWHHDVIRRLTVIGVANSVAAGGVMGLLLVLAVEQLGTTASGGGFGALLAVAAVGAFVAASILPLLSRTIPIGRITASGLAACIPAVLLLSLSTSVIASGIWLAIWSAGNTLVILNGISLRQQLTPDHLQARVNTTGRMVAWGGTPVGAIGCGLIAQTTDVGIAIAATSSVLAIGSIYGWTSGMWRRDFARIA